jgi:RNA polymerase sigma-70 factor (ECF subfamily)
MIQRTPTLQPPADPGVAAGWPDRPTTDEGGPAAPPAASNIAALEAVAAIVDGVLRRVLGAGDPDYEDLFQTSLANVIATMDRGSFRGDCPLEGWAAAIARNVAIDALRARSRDRRLFSRGEEDEVVFKVHERRHGPEHLAEVRRQLRQFQGALSRLRPSKAEVVYLHDVLGHDLVEVAAAVGTSVAAAQSRLSRGRREIIDKMGSGPRRRRKTPAPAGSA